MSENELSATLDLVSFEICMPDHLLVSLQEVLVLEFQMVTFVA